jgi:hypothetical protein
MKKKALLWILILMFISTIAYAACDDTDSDCICNDVDNCPDTWNSEQLDADTDGTGDLCDNDPGCGSCGQSACEKSLTAKVEELLTHYYLNILGRAPDSGGLNYWRDEIISLNCLGSDIKEGFISFAQAFFNSQEYLDKDRDDEEFVTDLYNTFFDRPPDSGGLNYWTTQLSQGMSRSIVLDNFVYSTEFNDLMDEIFNAGDYECPIRYIISGTVTGGVQEGVTVTLTGDNSATTITDSNGDYSFTGFSNGSYIVTPSKSGSTFNPENESLTVSGDDETGVNFYAYCAKYPGSFSGRSYYDGDQVGTWSASADNNGTMTSTDNEGQTYIGTISLSGYFSATGSYGTYMTGYIDCFGNVSGTWQNTDGYSGTASGTGTIYAN